MTGAEEIFAACERHGPLMAVAAAAVRYLDTAITLHPSLTGAELERYRDTTPAPPSRCPDTTLERSLRYHDTASLQGRGDGLAAAYRAVHAIHDILWQSACATPHGPSRQRHLDIARRTGGSSFIAGAAKAAERYRALHVIIDEMKAGDRQDAR